MRTQLFPPSGDCSPIQWKEAGVISVKRQRTARPAASAPSWTMSSPSRRPTCCEWFWPIGSIQRICQASIAGS
jgi:hypothetical protein